MAAAWPARLVCTGPFSCRGGRFLDGRTATTHWSRAKDLALRYPQVRVEEDRIWARDGNLYTSAGVSAGMDLALALIEEDLGAEVALAVARAMVMYLRRPGDQSQYSAPLRLQAAETPSVRELVAWPRQHPATDLSVPALAQRVGKSARHLTRVSARSWDRSREAIEQLRLEAARRALQQSASGLDEVAARCGFRSAEVLRRAFLRALHVTPPPTARASRRARSSPGETENPSRLRGRGAVFVVLLCAAAVRATPSILIVRSSASSAGAARSSPRGLGEPGPLRPGGPVRRRADGALRHPPDRPRSLALIGAGVALTSQMALELAAPAHLGSVGRPGHRDDRDGAGATCGEPLVLLAPRAR